MKYSYKSINELGKVITGKTPRTENSEYFNGLYPFITPTDIHSFNEKYLSTTERTLSDLGALQLKGNLLPKDSICFVCIGSTIGKMCKTKCDSFTNQQINSIIPYDDYNSDYLFYYMRYIKDYFISIGGGTGSGKGIINKTVFSKTKVKIVNDFDFQNKIAIILSKYDELIDINNKRIKLLEQAAEIYFRKSYESEIKNKNTSTIRLKEILSFTRGLSYSSEEIDCDEGITLVNLKNIQAYGGFRRDGNKLYNGEYKERQLVQQGDLIMGVTDMTQDRRTVGSVALVPFINGKSVISADLIKIISNINKSFLYCLFRYGNVSKYISQFANGANVLHLKPETVLKIKIQMPNEHFISSFSKIINPLLEEIELLNQKNEILVKQRDLLLPRLMNGKLEVK